MMIKKIQEAGSLLNRAAVKILLSITALILWALTYYSARYTETLQDGTEIPMTLTDSVGKNFMAFLIITAIFFLLRTILLKKSVRCSDRTRRIMITVSMVYITIVSVVWVTICHVMPRADSFSLCMVAACALQGKYDTMLPPGYISYYPHQFSLVAVIQLLFRLFGSGNYQSFQYMNALCMPLLFYSGYRLLMLAYGRLEPVLYYITAFVSCLPLFLYVPYVYGEISSITFTMVLMWQVVRYCVTGKKSCWFWGTLAAVFACMMRKNSMIVLIAVGIVLMLHSLRTARLQSAAWLLVMIIAVSTMGRGICFYYEKVSGNEMPDGIPYISWVLMGLKDGESGPGWFDGTSCSEMMLHDYNAELTAIDNREAVKERLRELWGNKAYAVDFFRRKVLSQWNSPAYHTLYETGIFDCEQSDLPEPVNRIYYENKDTVLAIMNRYQFILYLCTAIMTTAALFSKKSTCKPESFILLIAVTGGFLFSVLWEAMSRYILPYMTYMIPLAATGMWQLQELLARTTLNRSSNTFISDPG